MWSKEAILRHAGLALVTVMTEELSVTKMNSEYNIITFKTARKNLSNMAYRSFTDSSIQKNELIEQVREIASLKYDCEHTGGVLYETGKYICPESVIKACGGVTKSDFITTESSKFLVDYDMATSAAECAKAAFTIFL